LKLLRKKSKIITPVVSTTVHSGEQSRFSILSFSHPKDLRTYLKLSKLLKNAYCKTKEFLLAAVGNLKWDDLRSFYGEIEVDGEGYQFTSADVKNEYSFKTFDKNNNGLAIFFNMNQCVSIPEPKINYEIEKGAELDPPMSHDYRYNSCVC
jgi:hypothetical protein